MCSVFFCEYVCDCSCVCCFCDCFVLCVCVCIGIGLTRYLPKWVADFTSARVHELASTSASTSNVSPVLAHMSLLAPARPPAPATAPATALVPESFVKTREGIPPAQHRLVFAGQTVGGRTRWHVQSSLCLSLLTLVRTHSNTRSDGFEHSCRRIPTLVRTDLNTRADGIEHSCRRIPTLVRTIPGGETNLASQHSCGRN